MRLPVLLLAFSLVASGQSYREQRLTSELQQDPQNLSKTLQLASLKLEEVSGITNDQERATHLDEVQILYLKANSLDPRNVDALYHLGVISWMKVFPAVVAARRDAAMDPETPGPVRDRFSRAVLNARYRADINYAIASLEQAVAIDPANNAAMAYLQMAYRARADLKDSRAEWDEDQDTAGHWREKAYEVGTANQEASTQRQPAASWAVTFMPSAITIDPAELKLKLTHSEPAVCPAGLHVVGVVPEVILSAVIDGDGSVLYLERLDGPGELTDAAIEAARQWTYRPTLLNGRAMTVKSSIAVPFTPCPDNPDTSIQSAPNP